MTDALALRIETDPWPLIEAKYFKHVDRASPRYVRVIVVHDMEAPEKGDTAEKIARYFATLSERNADGSPVMKSAHLTIDAQHIFQCVHDRDIAYAAPGCNGDGLQLELAGYGSQTRDQWLDEYSRGVLRNAANAAAQYCLKFGLPPVRLTNAELADPTAKGIVSHGQVSQVFKKSDHTDPGPGFPWDVFLEDVAAAYAERLRTHGGG